SRCRLMTLHSKRTGCGLISSRSRKLLRADANNAIALLGLSQRMQSYRWSFHKAQHQKKRDPYASPKAGHVPVPETCKEPFPTVSLEHSGSLPHWLFPTTRQNPCPATKDLA